MLTGTNNGESDTQFTIRRQFVVTTNSSGAVTMSAGANETFLSHSESDYTISVLTSGTGTAKAGDIISAATGFSGGGTDLEEYHSRRKTSSSIALKHLLTKQVSK